MISVAQDHAPLFLTGLSFRVPAARRRETAYTLKEAS